MPRADRMGLQAPGAAELGRRCPEVRRSRAAACQEMPPRVGLAVLLLPGGSRS